MQLLTQSDSVNDQFDGLNALFISFLFCPKKAGLSRTKSVRHNLRYSLFFASHSYGAGLTFYKCIYFIKTVSKSQDFFVATNFLIIIPDKMPINAPARISIGRCTPIQTLPIPTKIAEIKAIIPHFLLK